MALKSVHITNYYHENSGGVKTNYDKLLEAAERHQRHVSLIVPGEKDHTEITGDYTKIYFVGAKKAPLIDSRYRLMMPWQYVFKDTAIRKILLAEMPDMIEVYDNYALTYLAGMIRMNYFKRLGRPMLVYFTGERLDTLVASFLSKGKFGKWFSRRLMGNFNLPMFDFYIANSQFVADELYESTDSNFDKARSDWFFNLCWRFFKATTTPLSERITICTRGVNTDFFTPNRKSAESARQIREKYGLPNDSYILLSSTRMSREKNIHLIPEIMNILKDDSGRDYRFLVAGDGPLAEYLKAETQKNFPGKLLVLGHLSKENLADLYANCDVFVHPNPREPFGNVALEAMASGAPVLVPNSGGILAYANDKNAWLAEPTAASFAENIRNIGSDDNLIGVKVMAGLETAKNNNQSSAIDKLFATYDKMYEEFIGNRDIFGGSTAPTQDFSVLNTSLQKSL